MNLPKIQIRTTPLKMGVKTSPSRMEMDSGNPISLNLQTTQGKLEMHTEQIRVEIDQSKCFEEAGLKSNASIIAETASFASQKAMEGLGRVVDQGNQFSQIESGSDPIPEQAVYNAFDQFISEWNLGFIPKSRPEIKIKGGTVDIDYKPAEVRNNTERKKVHFNYTKSKVETYVEQYNKIEFSVLDLKA